MSGQLEFIDVSRGKTRPAGNGEVIEGYFVYHLHSQRVDQVAYTLGCTTAHIYQLIQSGEFANATDISTDSAARACYRIPRDDVMEFIENRREGASK